MQLLVEITQITYWDESEGIVEFKTTSGNVYNAFFWGASFIVGEKRKIKLSHLNLHFEWAEVFNLNSSKEKKLESLNKDCEYIGYGQIEQVKPIIACFGDIKLDLGNWSSDERLIGEYIYWRIDRLEIALEV